MTKGVHPCLSWAGMTHMHFSYIQIKKKKKKIDLPTHQFSGQKGKHTFIFLGLIMG